MKNKDSVTIVLEQKIILVFKIEGRETAFSTRYFQVFYMVIYRVSAISRMSMDLQEVRKKILDALTPIVDPEIGVSIMELNLVDNVDIQDGNVKIDLHLTSPFCPAVFGFKIAQDVHDNVGKIEGVKKVIVNVSNHFMAEAINKQVNEGSGQAGTTSETFKLYDK